MSLVYILCGENLFLKEKRIEELKDKILSPQTAVLNCETYDGLTDDFNVLKEALQSPSLLGQKLIIINNADKLQAQKLKEALNLIQGNKSTTLILNSNDKKFAAQTAPSPQYKLEIFEKIYPYKIPEWLKVRAKEKGVHLTSEAADDLALNSGDDLRLLDSALEILVNFVDKKRRIDKEDVEKLVGVNLNENVFGLVNAVVELDAERALKLVDGILKTTQQPHGVLGVLAWHFTRILTARKIMEENGGIEGRRKIQQMFSLKEIFLRKLIEQVNAFNIQRLNRALNILLEADLNLKTLSVKPQYMLEMALIELCGL